MVNRFAPSPWAVAGTHALCAKISETPSLPGFSGSVLVNVVACVEGDPIMVNRVAPSPWAVAGTHALCAKISETPSLPGFSVEGGEGNAHEEVRKRCPPPSVVLASPGA